MADRAKRPPIQPLIDRFLEHIEHKPTRAVYRSDLGQLLEWCHSKQLDPYALSSQQVAQLRDELLTQHTDRRYRHQQPANTGLADSTVRRFLGAVCMLQEFLKGEGLISEVTATAAYVPRPQAEKDQPAELEILTDVEALALIGQAHREGPTEEVLVLLTLTYAQAVSHLDLLRRGGIDLHNNTITIYPRKGTTRQVPIVGDLKQALLDLLALLPEHPDQPLLTDHKTGKALSRFQAVRMLQKIGTKAGITTPITADLLRDTFMTAALATGTPITSIAHWTGTTWTKVLQFAKHMEGSCPQVGVAEHFSQTTIQTLDRYSAA